jgi:hypothetical protein
MAIDFWEIGDHPDGRGGIPRSGRIELEGAESYFGSESWRFGVRVVMSWKCTK